MNRQEKNIWTDEKYRRNFVGRLSLMIKTGACHAPVYNKAETLIMEYNEELRAWKNQAEQKKENPLEQRKKASVLEKLHRYQQEGRQQPKRSVKRKSMDRER